MAIKVITIDSFSGGRVNFPDQTLIPENTCASGSVNVWAPEGALTKTPGVVQQATLTATANAAIWGMWADDAVNQSYGLYYRVNVPVTGATTTYSYLIGSDLTLTGGITSFLGYSVGTLSISGANLISATGSGTSWATNIASGDMLIVTSLNGRYLVGSVEDNTHLTLAAAASAAVSTGSNYTIAQGLRFTEVANASLNGNLCQSTTADTFQVYNATSILRYTAGPKAGFLAVFKDYLFAARTSTGESRLYWSALRDPTTWPANNFIDIDKTNGKISGLFKYNNELIVFKTRGMFKVLGDIFDPSNPTYQVIPIAVPPDFIFNSNKTVAVHNGKLIFYAMGQIYTYLPGTLYITNVSHNIVRDMPNTSTNITDLHSSIDQDIGAIDFYGFYILKALNDPTVSTAAGSARLFGLVLDRNDVWWRLRNTNET